MAKRKSSGGNIADKVIVRHIQRTALFTLPVNPDFSDPNEIDQERGVDRDANEVFLGERYIVGKVIGYHVPANVRAWVDRMAQRRGGLPQLAQELMATAPVPLSYAPRSNKHNLGRTELYQKNLLRALQRSAKEKKAGRKEEHPTGIRDIDYLRRIGLYELQRMDVVLRVTGWWMHSEIREFKPIATNRREPEDLRKAQAVLKDRGNGFVQVIEDLVPAGMVLEAVNGLDVQVMPHGRQD